jgi:hypothetical protein
MSESCHRRPLEQHGHHQPGPLEVTDNSQRRGDEAPLVDKDHDHRHRGRRLQPESDAPPPRLATSSWWLLLRSCRRPGVATRQRLLGGGRLGRGGTPRTVTGWERAAVARPAGRALPGHLRSSPATRSATPTPSCQVRSGPPGVLPVLLGLPHMAVGHARRYARPVSRPNGTIGGRAGGARLVRSVFGHRRSFKRWCCRATVIGNRRSATSGR